MMDVDWSTLLTTYGTAVNFPALFNDLESEVESVWMSALERLLDEIYHQGTVCEATSYTLNVIFETINISYAIKQRNLIAVVALVASSVFSKKSGRNGVVRIDTVSVESAVRIIQQGTERLALQVVAFAPDTLVEYCLLLSFVVPFSYLNATNIVTCIFDQWDVKALSSLIWLTAVRRKDIEYQYDLKVLDAHLAKVLDLYIDVRVALATVYYLLQAEWSDEFGRATKILISAIVESDRSMILPWEISLLSFVLNVTLKLPLVQLIMFYSEVLKTAGFNSNESLDIGVALLNGCFPSATIQLWQLGLRQVIQDNQIVNEYYNNADTTTVYANSLHLNDFQKALLKLLYELDSFWAIKHNILTFYGLPEERNDLGLLLT